MRGSLWKEWEKELDYRLMKELWAFTDNRISVRFEYESRDPSGRWWRTHGNEHWEFNSDGLIQYLTEHWNTWHAYNILFNNFAMEPAHPTS